jgi:hypothetical protein
MGKAFFCPVDRMFFVFKSRTVVMTGTGFFTMQIDRDSLKKEYFCN